MKKGYAAFDFGASSGRLVLGSVENGKIVLEEIHRFPNEPVRTNGGFYWDFLRLFHEMKQGLKKLALKKDVEVQSIGIDTWGVDGGWLDSEDKLINQPVHYRDGRTKKIVDEVHESISVEEFYKMTGVQKQAFNTVYQLYHDKKYNPIIKAYGKSWLFMPDLFGFMLTGDKYNEYTIASTGSLIDPVTRNYNQQVFEKLGIPVEAMQKLVMPGTAVGTLTKEIQEEVGLGPVKVVAVGSHDTASAVAATPMTTGNEVYLVCGTWCLMGMELNAPCLKEEARKFDLTNEGGVEGTTRLLKNINGLWFLQQLKKGWNEEGMQIDFPDIVQAVKGCDHEYAIDAADERFLAPKHMQQEIVACCEEKYGIVLEGVGAIAKAAYNGLGQLYKETIESLEALSGKEIDTICMIGGGVKDTCLCEKVAEVTGKQVVAGPIEASSIGNVLMQMKGVGAIQTLEEGRELVKTSFETIRY
ncbi:MAG: rhamnulokinase [Cellulosilyticaceae bacterium]